MTRGCYKAEDFYERSLALLPESGCMHFGLGKLYLRQDQPELAALANGLLAELVHVPQDRALLHQDLRQAPDDNPKLVCTLALAALPHG